MSAFIRSGAILAGLALIAGCGAPAAKNDGKLPVVASTDVWGSVAAAVGGNRVDVRSLIDSPDKDPHDYDSSAADVAAIGAAKLTVYNGGGYDDFFGKAVDSAGTKSSSVNAFAISGKSGDDVNEHVFYDLPTVRKVAAAIGTELGKLDTAHAAESTANAQTFEHSIDGLSAQVATIGKGKNLSAIATESVADYLLSAAGIRESTPKPFAEAVEKDQDIPAAAIADTEQLINTHRVQLLIDNTQTESGTANQLVSRARAGGIRVVPVTETFPAGVHDYLQWMSNEIAELNKAAAQ